MSYFSGNCDVVCAYGVDAKHVRTTDLKVKDHANIPTLNTQKIQNDQILSLNANVINLNSVAGINTTGATLTINNNTSYINSQNTTINGQVLFINDNSICATASEIIMLTSPDVTLAVKTLTVTDVSAVNTLTITVQSGAPTTIASDGSLVLDVQDNLNINTTGSTAITSTGPVTVTTSDYLTVYSSDITLTSVAPLVENTPYTIYQNVALPTLTATITGGYFIVNGATATSGTFTLLPLQGGVSLYNMNSIQIRSGIGLATLTITVPTTLPNVIPQTGMTFVKSIPAVIGDIVTATDLKGTLNALLSTGTTANTILLNLTVAGNDFFNTYTTGNFNIEYLS